MKKLAIGAIAVALVLMLALNVIAQTPKEPKLPKEIQDRIDSRKNPSPYDKVIMPLSGTSYYNLNHKEYFVGPHKKSSSKIGGSKTSFLTNSIKFFNLESSSGTGNLPQNENSLIAEKLPSSSNQLVVGGANDYRGIWCLGLCGSTIFQGLSGYYVSNNNGASVLTEGALPPFSDVTDDTATPFTAESAGDPALAVHKSDGTVYYASLYADLNIVSGTFTNAVAIASASPTGLQTSSSPWSVGKVRADNSIQFNDKEWVAVDNSGGSFDGNAYVSWTVFSAAGSQIWLARCSPGSPPSCTTVANGGNPVSGFQTETQNSKVSVDSQGRVIITWIELNPVNPNPPFYSINLWYAVYAPGGTSLLVGPTLIKTLLKPVGPGFFAMEGNIFRVLPSAYNEPALSGSTPRLFVTYFGCGAGADYDFSIEAPFQFADTCSYSQLNLVYIDNYQSGNGPSAPIAITTSTSMQSFFPSIAVDQPRGVLNIAWYQAESKWKHKLYVENQQRSISSPTSITIGTQFNFLGTPATDVYFSGSFWGDYFQTYVVSGSPSYLYTHYTGNSRYSSPLNYQNLFDAEFADGFVFNIGGNNQDNMLLINTY